jgi:site-specific recombinase XerD
MSIETFFPDPTIRQRLYSGPLAAHIDVFAQRLTTGGYAASTAREKIRLIANLSCWLDHHKLTADSLNEPCICQFLDDRSRRGYTARDNAAFCRIFLAYLREIGCIPAAPTIIDDNPLYSIEHDYAKYLSQERGLAPTTLLNYLPIVHRFLTERFGTGPVRLKELRPQDIHQFILRRAYKVSPGHAKLIVTTLRSLFRYLHQRGDIAMDLTGAILGIANWRLAHLPTILTADQVEHLLACCDQSTPAGQRNIAILLLLARLGLRAGEVVAMTLDDIQWETGLLTIRGKGLRHETLPLPQDVGEVLAHYLRYLRPLCKTRRVFIRLKAPHQGFTTSAAICNIVQRALIRAELNPTCKGAHLLRHSLATRMLNNGASLAEIGDILRHRQLQTTQIYTKVDVKALRKLAQPWPGAVA